MYVQYEKLRIQSEGEGAAQARECRTAARYSDSFAWVCNRQYWGLLRKLKLNLRRLRYLLMIYFLTEA